MSFSKDMIAELVANIEPDLAQYRRVRRTCDTENKWVQIVKAKLSVINIIGGYELAKNICDTIQSKEEEASRQHDESISNDTYDAENDTYEFLNLASAFDHLATHVVDTWYC